MKAPKKGLARSNGQDLMRGQHVVGQKKAHTAATAELMEMAGGESASHQSGSSIFDPVLCELAYRWFCPPTGHILDPFAGGSVRGIVAAVLGRSYTGIDLRPEQVEANQKQWGSISSQLSASPTVQSEESFVRVKVSAAMARLPFHGCEPEYIRTTCHASCCESSTEPSGVLITIHPSESEAITARGGVIQHGMLQPKPGMRKCPFKTSADLCSLHETPNKPFGCIASPFTLNSTNTLIVRNRYKLLKCYNDGPKLPAYRAFRASLDRIFGIEEAARISAHLDGGGGDLMAQMRVDSYQMLLENDALKRGDAVVHPPPAWVVGDSQEIATLAPGEYDFCFTCPPYGDLEVYSDDPRDISTFAYPDFLKTYREIIHAGLSMLRQDRFAAIVVGDFRDEKGFYRNFVNDTIQAFHDGGARLYNEAILVTALGSLPIRAGKAFTSSRKLGKTHQQFLVFCKGDPRKATEACGEVEVGDLTEFGVMTADGDQTL